VRSQAIPLLFGAIGAASIFFAMIAFTARRRRVPALTALFEGMAASVVAAPFSYQVMNLQSYHGPDMGGVIGALMLAIGGGVIAPPLAGIVAFVVARAAEGRKPRPGRAILRSIGGAIFGLGVAFALDLALSFFAGSPYWPSPERTAFYLSLTSLVGSSAALAMPRS
jgi:hypothetical protein